MRFCDLGRLSIRPSRSDRSMALRGALFFPPLHVLRERAGVRVLLSAVRAEPALTLPSAARTTAWMPKPVYALVGSDAFLQLEALANLLRETGADVQRVDADGETAQLADVLDELRSFAMFGGGKLVVVRNADAFLTKFRESLEDYVAAPSNSAIQV